MRLESLPAARRWIAERGFDPVLGARPMARLIERELKDRLADDILFGRLASGGTVRVEVNTDGMIDGKPGEALTYTVSENPLVRRGRKRSTSRVKTRI